MPRKQRMLSWCQRPGLPLLMPPITERSRRPRSKGRHAPGPLSRNRKAVKSWFRRWSTSRRRLDLTRGRLSTTLLYSNSLTKCVSITIQSPTRSSTLSPFHFFVSWCISSNQSSRIPTLDKWRSTTFLGTKSWGQRRAFLATDYSSCTAMTRRTSWGSAYSRSSPRLTSLSCKWRTSITTCARTLWSSLSPMKTWWQLWAGSGEPQRWTTVRNKETSLCSLALTRLPWAGTA